MNIHNYMHTCVRTWQVWIKQNNSYTVHFPAPCSKMHDQNERYGYWVCYIKRYSLLLATGLWCSEARKVTAGLAESNGTYTDGYSPNSTWLVSTWHVRRVEPMHFGCVELVEQHDSTLFPSRKVRIRNSYDHRPLISRRDCGHCSKCCERRSI